MLESGAPLSSSLEEVLYKCSIRMNEWINNMISFLLITFSKIFWNYRVLGTFLNFCFDNKQSFLKVLLPTALTTQFKCYANLQWQLILGSSSQTSGYKEWPCQSDEDFKIIWNFVGQDTPSHTSPGKVYVIQ